MICCRGTTSSLLKPWSRTTAYTSSVHMTGQHGLILLSIASHRWLNYIGFKT